jgi:hypothetical protein
MRKQTGVAPLLAAAIAVAGCGSNSKSTQTQAKVPAKPGEPMPSSSGGGPMSAMTGAKIAILAPTPGAVVRGNEVPWAIRLSDFRISCPLAGTGNKMGAGHLHVELDGSLINMFCSTRGTVSMQNVKPGMHTLTILAAENDHTDDMHSAHKVTFDYAPTHPLPVVKGDSQGDPSIKILSPAPGSTVHDGFALTVVPTNFEFSCALYGKPDVAGYGHWHINADSTSKGMMGMGTMLRMSCARTFHVSTTGLSPGRHTFFAILEDNQHAPTPHAEGSVTVNVS